MAGALSRDCVENSPHAVEIVTLRVPIYTTLLELVTRVSQLTDDEREVIDTIAHLVNSGKVILRGSFVGHSLPVF